MKNCDQKTFELLVLGCWAHEEISIGRARELLGWSDTKIKEQAEKRVSNAVKLREHTEALEEQVKHWEKKWNVCYDRAVSDMIRELQSMLEREAIHA